MAEDTEALFFCETLRHAFHHWAGPPGSFIQFRAHFNRNRW